MQGIYKELPRHRIILTILLYLRSRSISQLTGGKEKAMPLGLT